MVLLVLAMHDDDDDDYDDNALALKWQNESVNGRVKQFD